MFQGPSHSTGTGRRFFSKFSTETSWEGTSSWANSVCRSRTSTFMRNPRRGKLCCRSWRLSALSSVLKVVFADLQARPEQDRLQGWAGGEDWVHSASSRHRLRLRLRVGAEQEGPGLHLLPEQGGREPRRLPPQSRWEGEEKSGSTGFCCFR